MCSFVEVREGGGSDGSSGAILFSEFGEVICVEEEETAIFSRENTCSKDFFK
jgi:hypothetical protein